MAAVLKSWRRSGLVISKPSGLCIVRLPYFIELRGPGWDLVPDDVRAEAGKMPVMRCEIPLEVASGNKSRGPPATFDTATCHGPSLIQKPKQSVSAVDDPTCTRGGSRGYRRVRYQAGLEIP